MFDKHANIIQHVFNKTFEEEFEEPDVVPYKVELANVDADDQQR